MSDQTERETRYAEAMGFGGMDLSKPGWRHFIGLDAVLALADAENAELLAENDDLRERLRAVEELANELGRFTATELLAEDLRTALRTKE